MTTDTIRGAVERVIAGLNKHDPQDMEIIAPMLRALLADNERLKGELELANAQLDAVREAMPPQKGVVQAQI